MSVNIVFQLHSPTFGHNEPTLQRGLSAKAELYLFHLCHVYTFSNILIILNVFYIYVPKYGHLTPTGPREATDVNTRFVCSVSMVFLDDMTASQLRQKEQIQNQYKHKVSRLQKQVDALQQRGTTVDGQQSTSPVPPSSQLRLYIDHLERHEDRYMKNQMRLVKDFGRRLERIEDIGCSYFKPRSARCRIQEELFARLNKGQLHGIVKPDHICQV